MAATEQTGEGFAANLNAGMSILLFAYVAIAVLRQTDAELILPNSTFDLGGLIDKFKDGVPGGSFVAPILQIKLPLYLFYTVGPVLLVALHAVLVLRPSTLDRATPQLRLTTIWLPPAVLALIIWRFNPYLASRPEPPLTGLAMEGLQYLALAADAPIVIFSIIYSVSPSELPGQSDRYTAAILRAFRHATLIGLIMILLIGFRPDLASGKQLVFADLALSAFVFFLGIALAWVRLREGKFVGAKAAAEAASPWYRPEFPKEDLDMQGRIYLASLFLGLAAFPAFGRSLDLSGESLVARGPSELMLAALIVASKAHGADELAHARGRAWIEYGRGITLDRWNFDHARFDRADMANIRLRRANLRSASLDHANLIKADLVGADFRGASLRYADLLEANLVGTKFRGASLRNSNLLDARGTVVAQSNAPANAGATTSQPVCANIKREDRVDFSGADLSGADLTNADLTCSILRGVTMDSHTILEKTKLGGANLCGSTLVGVDLSVADGAASAIFAHTDLTRALIPANMASSQLKDAFVKGTRFRVDTTNRKLSKAKAMGLTQTNLEDADKRLSHCEEKDDPGTIPAN